jgi:anaerobic magnesium-protoporphyrin IX monomethyl ester cyclase
MRARVTVLQPADGLVYKWARKRTKRMPLGMAYVATAAAKAGHDVSIVDGSLEDLTVEETIERALANDPHVVGITCTTPLFHLATEICKGIKRRSPKTAIAMGGPHPGALPIPTLKTSGCDFVAVGEGEVSFPSMIDCVMDNGNPNYIPSSVYNWNGVEGQTGNYIRYIKEKSIRDRLTKAIDLNDIPYPDRSLFKYREYCDYARDFEGPQTMTMFSRGCPGKCAFCGAADTLVRFRDLENIYAELEVIRDLGIKNISVNDDTYTSNKRRVIELSNGIVKRGFKFDIAVQLRLDQIDREICDALFASGIKHVGPGIESGNDTIIKAIGKGPKESKENMRGKMALLQEYDWKTRNSYVFGMPGETEEQIMETIEFAKELGADENAFSILVPYPDSPLWHFAKDKGQVDDYMDFSKFLYYHEIGCNLSAVPTERLLELHEFAYEYVGNPAYNFEDDAVSSGNRPHIPYLASEAFKRHRLKTKVAKENYIYDEYSRRFDDGVYEEFAAYDRPVGVPSVSPK